MTKNRLKIYICTFKLKGICTKVLIAGFFFFFFNEEIEGTQELSKCSKMFWTLKLVSESENNDTE